MTEPTVQDSAIADSSVQDGSATGQPNSGDSVDLVKQIKELAAQVHALQGDKDRGVRRVEQQVSDLSARLTDYEAYRSRGLGPDEAMRQMRIDQLLQSQNADRPPEPAAPAPPPGNPGMLVQAPKVDVEQVLTAIGVDPNGPEAVLLYREGKTSPEALLEFAVRKLTRKPDVNPAQTMPAPGMTSAPAPDLMAEYAKKAAALPRGSQALFNLRAEYRAKGLQL